LIFGSFGYRLHRKGYSEKPMTILDPEPRAMLSAIIEITLIETGSRSARERWQQIQLRNLVNHVSQRSAFWRTRIGSRKASDVDLAALPVLTRQDVRKQVAAEGPLLRPADGFSTDSHSTSGSSGVPLRFFVSNFNSGYNFFRSIAQYCLEGRDLALNRTRLADAAVPDGIFVRKEQSWIGALSSLLKSGKNKEINCFTLRREECVQVVDELKKDDVGYLVAAPWHMEAISSSFDLDFLKQAKTEMWIPLGGEIGPNLAKTFANLAIPVRANYSSSEVGMIGAACSKFSDYYHVATSNVMVEVVDRRFEINGITLGKVLVTHLHSYATPFIRYDLGDLACLRAKCPCGHDGPTIYNLQGRASSVVKHRDGRLSLFFPGQALAALTDFTEYRMRQTDFDKIVVELGGRSGLNAREIAAITTCLQGFTGLDFNIEVKACEQIDWGQSRKKLGFRCDI
jgi:phenylacetate-CoA ligase